MLGMVTQLDAPTCDEPSCDSPARSKSGGLCMRHYQRIRRQGTTNLSGPPPRACLACGTAFTPGSNRGKYCTDCGRRGQAICEQCGASFKRKAGGNYTGRWCSVECAMAARTLPDMQRRPCEHCGTDFKPRHTGSRFCSKSCSSEASRRPDRECPACGKVYNSRHYSGTCSHQCAATLRRKEPEGHPCERCGVQIPWSANRFRRFCSRACRDNPIGFRKTTPAGYVLIRVGSDHPAADKAGYIPEHRHVIEQQIGRTLKTWERVHHKNGRRDDNRPENLELWKVKDRNKKDPAGVRADDYHCPGCRCAELPFDLT